MPSPLSHNMVKIKYKVVKVKTKQGETLFINTNLVQLVKVTKEEITVYFTKQDRLILTPDNVENFDEVKTSAICFLGYVHEEVLVPKGHTNDALPPPPPPNRKTYAP